MEEGDTGLADPGGERPRDSQSQRQRGPGGVWDGGCISGAVQVGRSPRAPQISHLPSHLPSSSKAMGDRGAGGGGGVGLS